MKESKPYYKRIDIIRDISCILVLLYHLNILKGGFLAVCTFFVLSGYLSCMSALKNKDFSIKSYYLNRLKKIYLPLIIVAFITVIIAKLFPSINWINLKQETTSVVLGYNNFWQLNANLDYFTRNVNSPFMHFWYIAILLQFDLIFPIIVAVFKNIKSRAKDIMSTVIVFLLTIGATVLFYHMSQTQDIMIVYYNTFARSFSILFGVLLAMVHYKFDFKISKLVGKFNTLFFLLYSIALIVLCIVISNDSKNYAIIMIVVSIISTRLIAYSTVKSNREGMADGFIEDLAKISYEIYLVQYPVIFFMQSAINDDLLRIIAIAVITVITSAILHMILDFSTKSKIIKCLKIIILGGIIVCGSLIVITEKDYTKEMDEMKQRFNENEKLIEEKNKDFYVDENAEKEAWNALLENKTDEDKNKKEENKTSEESNTTEENKTEEKKEENKKDEENKNDEDEDEEEVTDGDRDKIEAMVKKLQVVGVGDSVMLDAVKAFYNQFPKGYFDGKMNRTISKATSIIKSLKSQGKLSNTVILSLATNGDYSESLNKKMMDELGNRQVYWINAVGPDDPKFNDKFNNFASNYSNLHIVDLQAMARKHPEYLEPDKIHPNYKGGKAMAKLVFDTICDEYLKQYKSQKANN